MADGAEQSGWSTFGIFHYLGNSIWCFNEGLFNTDGKWLYSFLTTEPSRQATAGPSFSRLWHLISWHTPKIQTVLSKHITPLKQTPQCSRGVLSTLQSSASHSHGDITARDWCSAGQAPLQPGRQLRSDGQQALKCQAWQQLLESWQTPSPSCTCSVTTPFAHTLARQNNANLVCRVKSWIAFLVLTGLHLRQFLMCATNMQRE